LPSRAQPASEEALGAVAATAPTTAQARATLHVEEGEGLVRRLQSVPRVFFIAFHPTDAHVPELPSPLQVVEEVDAAAAQTTPPRAGFSVSELLAHVWANALAMQIPLTFALGFSRSFFKVNFPARGVLDYKIHGRVRPRPLSHRLFCFSPNRGHGLRYNSLAGQLSWVARFSDLKIFRPADQSFRSADKLSSRPEVRI
jgi:hypothetical protein